MAIDLSSVQPGPCMAKVETAVGAEPAGFTADTCGFFTIASVNPFTPDLQYQEFMREQGYNMEQAEKFASILQKFPEFGITIEDIYGLSPSVAAQLLGALGAGIGIAADVATKKKG